MSDRDALLEKFKVLSTPGNIDTVGLADTLIKIPLSDLSLFPHIRILFRQNAYDLTDIENISNALRHVNWLCHKEISRCFNKRVSQEDKTHAYHYYIINYHSQILINEALLPNYHSQMLINEALLPPVELSLRGSANV